MTVDKVFLFLSRFNSRNGGFSLSRREEEFFFRETIPSTSLSSLESKTPICKNCAECTKDLRTAPRNRSQVDPEFFSSISINFPKPGTERNFVSYESA